MAEVVLTDDKKGKAKKKDKSHYNSSTRSTGCTRALVDGTLRESKFGSDFRLGERPPDLAPPLGI
eukprot:1195483-Prorocentrum_minimum.AAC.3